LQPLLLLEVPQPQMKERMLTQSTLEGKIAVMKVVKEVLALGLKEAKDLVDGAPVDLKANVKKAEAEEMKKKLEEAGATVELK
jgi:large subunit ribosomal protein L7/L12